MVIDDLSKDRCRSEKNGRLRGVGDLNFYRPWFWSVLCVKSSFKTPTFSVSIFRLGGGGREEQGGAGKQDTGYYPIPQVRIIPADGDD